MKKNFLNTVKIQKPTTSVFDLSHDVKMSGNMGNLIPILVMECIPGDKHTISNQSLIRFAPMIAPVMHRVNVTTHYFFVPRRVVWEGFEEWSTNHNSGRVVPYLTISEQTTPQHQKFLDYMGIPPCPVGGTAVNINAEPLAAYLKIYEDYYRDQNLIPETEEWKLVDGYNPRESLITMRRRAWEHDYFTASLPFAQKGAAVDIPLGEVRLKSGWQTGLPLDTWPKFEDGTGFAGAGIPINQDIGTDGNLSINLDTNIGTAYNPLNTLEVGATTINDLRRAFKLQEWLEKNARGGNRYIESILIHFGVRSSDARLQRAEYIGGSITPVTFSEVLNTTGFQIPQGEMAGHGVAVGEGKPSTFFCEEHGFIIGIMSIMPKTAYQQGIPKMWLKRDSMELLWPEFAHLGEMPVYNEEIYAFTPNPKGVFGYLPQYAEYRYMPSRVAGDMRTTLDFWHLGRIFDAPPALNKEFIECTPEDTLRIFAVNTPDVDHLYIHLVNRIMSVRKLPFYGTPTF